mmetsp:Transcript_5392/g.20134  ORF Transcript_5392/g.20134 Transcript_5392/m.20134 type:complete len:133 (-) Transcript_5392:5515-5913(-)
MIDYITKLFSSRVEEKDDSFVPELSANASEDDHGSCRDYGMSKEEFLTKLKRFAHDKYNDDWEALFNGYRQGDDKNLLSWEGLCFMMRDAQIGNTLIRPVMATSLIVQLDKDEDRKLSLEEFMKIKNGEFEG